MENKIVAIIPARGGSKGLPGKNVKVLGGYPLIAYSVIAAKLTKGLDRIIVSTDSKEIARVAMKYGAEVPFMRPVEISQDSSTDLELFCHVIQWFEKNSFIPHFLIHLRPTTPFRDVKEMERALELIQSRPESTALRSVHELSEPPHKMFQLDQNGYLAGFFPDDQRSEYYNLPRQAFPKAYHPNGYVDIIKTDFVRSNNNLHGSGMLGFVTPIVTEVDRLNDFDYLEYQLKRAKNSVYQHLIKNFPRED